MMDRAAGGDVELEQIHVDESTSIIDNKRPRVHFQEQEVLPFSAAGTITEKCVCVPEKGWYYSVTIQGNRIKPAIVTLHDIGLNSEVCFGGFFNYPQMEQLRHHFCVYHLTVMGQETNASDLPNNFDFPSLGDLADMIGSCVSQFQIQHFVGLAVGVGANIMARFATQQPNMIDALCLINCTASAPGWSAWGSQLMSGWMNNSIFWHRDQKAQLTEYLMWHYFGTNMEHFPDIVNYYRTHFGQVSSVNLSKFYEKYAQRTDIAVAQEGAAKDKTKAIPIPISAPTLLIAAQWSSFFDDTVAMNSRMRPDRTEFMQVSETDGAVLDEIPDKVSQALVLHLQGCGYVSQFFVQRKLSDRGDH